VEDVTLYQGALYAATERGLFKRDPPDGNWSQVSLPPAAPSHVRYVVSDDQGYLMIAGEGTQGRDAIWVLDPKTAKWTTATSGLANVHGFNAFQTIAGAVYLPSDVGILRLDVNTRKWIADPNNGLFGSVTAVPLSAPKVCFWRPEPTNCGTRMTHLPRVINGSASSIRRPFRITRRQ